LLSEYPPQKIIRERKSPMKMGIKTPWLPKNKKFDFVIYDVNSYEDQQSLIWMCFSRSIKFDLFDADTGQQFVKKAKGSQNG